MACTCGKAFCQHKPSGALTDKMNLSEKCQPGGKIVDTTPTIKAK